MSFTIQSILYHSSLQLISSTPRLDVEILLCHVLQVTRTYLYTWHDRVLTYQQYEQFQQLITQRIEGKPIAYLIGQKEFWSLSLQVSSATLIPRPETEILVEQALTRLSNVDGEKIVDLGTGCGTIALAIAHQCPHHSVLAVDCDADALAIARSNAHRLRLDNVTFRLSHWFSEITTSEINMIVSNPPYIAECDPHLLQGDVRYEPRHALISGKEGLTAIRHIIQQAPQHLLKNGWLLLEHGYNQGEIVRSLLKQQNFHQIETYRDLADVERVTVGCIMS